jgi:hypothetical protein
LSKDCLYALIIWSKDFEEPLGSVLELKLFVSAPAPAPTFKKFRLRHQSRSRLRLKLFVYLFSELLNEKVDFSWLFVKNIDLQYFTLRSYSIGIMIIYTTLVWPGAGAGAETSVYRLQLRLRPKVPAPCGSSSGSGSTTLPLGTVVIGYWIIALNFESFNEGLESYRKAIIFRVP